MWADSEVRWWQMRSLAAEQRAVGENTRSSCHQVEHACGITRTVLRHAGWSRGLDLVAQVAIELYWSEGDKDGLTVAPLIERLRAALAQDELPLASLVTLHAAFRTENIFNMEVLRASVARARVYELRLPDIPVRANHADWTASNVARHRLARPCGLPPAPRRAEPVF